MKKSLQGKRIVVTRNEPQASAFGRDIQARGGVPVIVPLIRIVCTYNQEKIKALHTYEWIVFTSANGVRCFHEALEENDALHVMDGVQIAAVGSKTARALHVFGREADFIPSTYDGKTMAPEFIASKQRTGNVLIVHGRLSGTILQETFQAEGIAFDCLEVYATLQNEDERPRLKEIAQQEHIDVITFMSPSTVDAWMNMIPNPKSFYEKTVVCIGSTTEKRARERGFKDVYVPEMFTAEEMLTCMEQVIEKERKKLND